MSEKLLCVDDEPHVLDGIRRHLARKVTTETALSGADGLRLLQESGPYAVVISDMRMPGMTGAQFLTRVREIAPDSVRIILSGHADLAAAIEAVNEGQIFRFLTKPCSPDALWSAVDAGLTHFRLVHAERNLLEDTLSGAVKMLTEVVGLANPAAYSRAARVQRYALAIAQSLGVGNHWELRLAAMLSQIGCITLPPEVITKVYSNQTLEGEERRLYDAHADVTAKLLDSIPRLEGVAEIIAGQMRRPDLTGASQVVGHWDSTRLGTLVLRAATELDELIARGMRVSVALQKLTESWPELPAAIADALRATRIAMGETIIRAIALADLSPGMVLDEDLNSSNGIRLVPQRPGGHQYDHGATTQRRRRRWRQRTVSRAGTDLSDG